MIEVRPIAPGDLPAAARFDQVVDRPRNSTFDADFFAWQYLDGADGPRETGGALAAWHGDRVVATLMMSETDFLVEGRIVRGGIAHEWYADPEHGFIGLELFAKALPRLPVIIGAGPSMASMITSRRPRPQIVYPLTRLVAILDPARAADLSFARTAHTVAYLQSLTPRKAPPGAPAGEVAEGFGDAYQAAWRAMAPAPQLAVDRSAGYMEWRYRRHPRFRYHILRCQGARGDAWFVWRAEDVAGKGVVARLCEAIGPTDALADGAPALLARWRATPGLIFGDFFCGNDAVCAALVEGGFSHALTLPGLDLPRLFSPLAPDPRKTLYFWISVAKDLRFTPRLEPGRAYFTKGDANQDRPNP